MFVTRLILKNWRNFRSVDVELGLRVFVAGPNASGKSILLDVFTFLKDVAKPSGGLQNAVTERGGISKLRCLAGCPRSRGFRDLGGPAQSVQAPERIS